MAVVGAGAVVPVGENPLGANADLHAAAAAGAAAAFQKEFASIRTMFESFDGKLERLSKEVKAKRKNDEVDSRVSKRRTTLEAVKTETPEAGKLLRLMGAQVGDLEQAETALLKMAVSAEPG